MKADLGMIVYGVLILYCGLIHICGFQILNNKLPRAIKQRQIRGIVFVWSLNDNNKSTSGPENPDNQYQEIKKILLDVSINQAKTDKQLAELIGYNQNQDFSLEFKLGLALKSYIINELGVPPEYIVEYISKVLYNPNTGDTAVEWDAEFLIDYTDKPVYKLLGPRCPPQNTVFLLEVKQTLKIEQVLANIPRRVNITRDVIQAGATVRSTPRKRKVEVLLSFQEKFFLPNPSFIVAVGGRNANATLEKAITDCGYLAIVPTGDDFKVVSKDVRTI